MSLFLLQACATVPEPPKSSVTVETDATPVPPNPQVQAQEQIVQMQARIQDLETRLTAMNEKINLKLNPESETKIVQAPLVTGKKVQPSRSKNPESEEAMVQDEAADRYREAKILFDSNRFSDSVIEFSDFLKAFPRHAFAPAAQYFLGMAYLKQKEYKIAEEELSRGLISYPHSQYIPDTLRAMMEISEQLKKPEKVTYFEQRILMLFPNSPQAKGLTARATLPGKKPSIVPATSSKGSPETADPSVEESHIEKVAPVKATAPTAPVPPTAPTSPTMDPMVEDGESHS